VPHRVPAANKSVVLLEPADTAWR